jgi:hypothetical protein
MSYSRAGAQLCPPAIYRKSAFFLRIELVPTSYLSEERILLVELVPASYLSKERILLAELVVALARVGFVCGGCVARDRYGRWNRMRTFE